MEWKKRENNFHGVEKREQGMNGTRTAGWVALAGWLVAAAAWGVPVIQHDPIEVAEKGSALGVRASVRDAAARVESVSLF